MNKELQQMFEYMAKTIGAMQKHIAQLEEEIQDLKQNIQQPATVKIYLDQDAQVPVRGTANAGGYDVYSREHIILQPGQKHMFDLGIRMNCPPNYTILTYPRSGLGIKRGVILNPSGVIDADYRGVIQLPLYNSGTEPQEIQKGERIAQFVFVQYGQIEFETVDSPDKLSKTDRGIGGFGSSGRTDITPRIDYEMEMSKCLNKLYKSCSPDLPTAELLHSKSSDNTDITITDISHNKDSSIDLSNTPQISRFNLI